MKLKFTLPLLLLIILLSCTSDPCEAVECGPGTCIEGTCDCPSGYFGASCEENIFGLYAASSMNSADCSEDFDIPAMPNHPASEGGRICYPFNGGQNCFFYRIELKSDFTFSTTFNQIAITPNGAEVLVNANFPSGTYVINENEIIVTFENNESQKIQIDNSILLWDISQARSDEFPNCRLELEFAKTNQ